jgi:hypothetical protein
MRRRLAIEHRGAVMPRSKPKLYLPFDDRPEGDKDLWHAATENDDPFTGGAHGRLAKSTLHVYRQAWRAFLGLLSITELAALADELIE